MGVLSRAVRLNTRARVVAGYVTALALCVLVLAVVFDVRSDARRWPYAYRGDTMFYHLIAKISCFRCRTSR